jgi:hypothetical protein
MKGRCLAVFDRMFTALKLRQESDVSIASSGLWRRVTVWLTVDGLRQRNGRKFKRRNVQEKLFLYISTVEDETCTLSGNVGNRLPSDAK